MKKEEKLILEQIYGINLQKKPLDLLEELEGEINSENEISLEEIKDEDLKEIYLSYKVENSSNKALILSIAAGLPSKEFLKAESLYKEVKEKYDEDSEDDNKKNQYKYFLEGSLLAGSLAQYAAIMSEGFVENYHAVTYNPIGIANFLEFQGNEFLGLKAGLLYFLNDIYYDQRSMMKEILYKFEDIGLIKYGNISNEYKSRCGEAIKEEKVKNVIINVFEESLDLEKDEAKELLEKYFDPDIIECKMRFIDRYKMYKEKSKTKDEKILNYIFSENIPANLYPHLGQTYIIDNSFKNKNTVMKKILPLIENLEEDQLEQFIEHDMEFFEPFFLIEEGGNGRTAKNRFRKRPEIGEITDRISNDYLRGLVKEIILEIQNIDDKLLIDIFKLCRQRTEVELQKLIRDRLRYSMKERGLISEDELSYKSTILINKPDLFSDLERTYPLDRVVIRQFRTMPYREIRELWKWKISGEGIYLILGTEIETEEDIIEYHSSSNSFTNEMEEIKLELDQPSQNKIYGSLRKAVNYKDSLDIDYHHAEEEAYNFSSNQGVGFTLLTKHKDPERRIKIDDSDIAGEYPEKDREDADIGDRPKTLRDSYFGDNIILRNMKRNMGEISGDLIYIYGPEKKDQLIIEGFANGDYGIELNEKAREASENDEPLTYTDYKIRFDPFEFSVLEELEIKRTIYDHTRVIVRGEIRKEDLKEYMPYLDKENPELKIYYENDETKILFKGIIKKSIVKQELEDYYLEIEALSYSFLLERRRKNRIFQNMGTSYDEVLEKIKDDNQEFHIYFSDSSLGGTALVTEDYPIVLQYKESEWDFIKRLASYTGEILIVDDTKDDSETINIQVSHHHNTAKELNNRIGIEKKKTSIKNTKFKYYKVEEHEHYRSDNILELGKKIKYKVDNISEEEIELIIIQNKIYMKNQLLCSDYTLVKEEDIRLLKELRTKPLEGRVFRAEVMEVNEKHQAKVKFLDIEDDFDQSKAYLFPIDRIYTHAFFAPEVGDKIDIYFKARNEKHATLKGVTYDENEKIDHDPDDKYLITPGGYQMLINNQLVCLASKEEKTYIKLEEEESTIESNKSMIKMDKKEISIGCKKAVNIIDNKKIQIGLSNMGIKISKNKINMS
ncbi:contractile injection system protein, VgrG/Pvc8 family [Natronospora cellulosivora (SeqCode)]